MMYGSNLVLRTAANLSSTVTSTVTSTVNTVASVAGSSRRKSTERNHGGMLAHAKEKVALSVKCSPNKDANTTSNLSIKSGFLMKKNEQGSFQRRFVCIVPHMFLYYFENEMADSPRGIIDLELLDNITREHDVLKLSTADEHNWRSFFFQDADGDALTEWMTALIRDRYHTVVEERNAYQAMQSEMTGAIDTQSSLAKSREEQRQQLEQEAEKYRHLYQDAYNYLQISLVELGISDDEMSRLSDVHKLGTELKHRIVALRDLFHRQMEENNNRFDAELQEQQAVVTELQRQLATELTARTKLEALLIAERREREQLDKDHALQYGNLQIDLQLAIAAKDDVEAKANVLHDQKRLLVKEVKLLRKKLEETQVLLEEMKHMNSQLADTAEALRKEVEELEKFRTEHQQQQQSQQSSHGGGGGSDAPSTSRSMMERLFSDHHSLVHRVHHNATTTATAVVDDDAPHDATSGGSGGGVGEKKRNASILTDDGDERSSWDLPPNAALKELGSLYPSHVAHGGADASPMTPATATTTATAATPAATSSQPATPAPAPRRSSLSMLSKVMFGDLGTSSSHGSASTATAAVSSGSPHSGGSEATSTSSAYRGGASLLSSMFGSVVGSSSSSSSQASASTAATPATVVDASSSSAAAASTTAADGASSAAMASFFAPSIIAEDAGDEGRGSFSSGSPSGSGRFPSTMRLTCLRCKGSVEGPKYSTCKCAVPALSPDDLTADASSVGSAATGGSGSSGSGGGVSSGGAASSLSSSSALSALTGMFSKGSSVAGGLVEGLMQYTNNPMADATAGSSHSTGNMSPKRATVTASASTAAATVTAATATTTETTAAAVVTDASEATPADAKATVTTAATVEAAVEAADEPSVAADANEAAATTDEPSAEASGDNVSCSDVASLVDEDHRADDAPTAAPSEAANADAPSAGEDAAEVDETTL